MVYLGFSVAANCSTASVLHSTTQPAVKASTSASSLDEASLRLLLATTVPPPVCSLRFRPHGGLSLSSPESTLNGSPKLRPCPAGDSG
jgi:hypothetical protein